MPCYHPRDAWRSATRNPNGKRPLVFDATKGLSTHPVTLPCGGCIGCRLDKARDWANRIMHEKQFHQLSTFVTLTYEDAQLPKNGSLDLRHTQLFLKRLRKFHSQNNQNPIRFFLCGEYGETTFRPHYHAILFGVDFSDKRKHSENGQGHILYRSNKLNELWGHGHCLTGQVTNQSAEYVARYCMKKVNGKMAEEHYQGRKPEFITMSRRPGLGANFYEKYKDNLLARDFVTSKGKQAPVPKYYDRLLSKTDEETLAKIKTKRIQRASLPLVKYENTDERLKVRKECREAKLKQLNRKSI